MKLPAGIESRLKQTRDWLVEEEKSPSTGAVSMTPAEERRRAIALLASGVLLGGIFSTSAKTERDILQGKGEVEDVEVHERVREFDEDELTENRIEMFKVVFANLTRDQVVFVDQNWNMIGGGPIEVSDEIKELNRQVAQNGGAKREELLTKRRELFQTWLNDMRKKLKEQYPTIEFDISPERKDFEKPEQFSVYASLMDEPEGTTKLDVVLRNSQRYVVFDKDYYETHLGYGEEITRFDFVRNTLFARVPDKNLLMLPELLQELLAALPAIESMYDPTLVNTETGATGAWQIMKEFGREQGLVKNGYDDRRKFVEATEKMADYFAALYKTIKNNPDVKQLQNIYGLNEEHIVYPLMLSSYHSGFGRNISQYQGSDGNMRDGMVPWFLANVSPEMIRQHIGNPPYGRDLFTFMTTLYMNQSGDRRYFKKSRDYYASVAAFRDLLMMKNPGKVEVSGEYAPPSDMISERMPKRRKLSARAEHVALLVGGAALIALADVFRRKEVTRRGLFRSLGAVGATSLLGSAYGASLVERPIPRPLEPSVPFQKPQIGPQSLTIDEGLAERLFKQEGIKLDTPLLTETERTELRRRRNPDLQRWLRANGDRCGFKAVKDTDEIFEQRLALSLLPEKTWGYRLRGVGNPPPMVPFIFKNRGTTYEQWGIPVEYDDGEPSYNDMRYAYAEREVKGILERLAHTVDFSAHKNGLPGRYQVRLLVNSASRTLAYQTALREKYRSGNAGQWSSHTYLNSFDLSRFFFDVIDMQTGKFNRINRNSVMPEEARFSEQLEAILGREILKLMKEKKILAFREGGAEPCFHIMVTP